MHNTGPQFTADEVDRSLIGRIVRRALQLAKDNDLEEFTSDHRAHIALFMDIEACHCTDCPLDLVKLLSFSDADFGHDVFGINKYLNRDTGRLKKNFFPRCSAKVTTNDGQGTTGSVPAQNAGNQ